MTEIAFRPLGWQDVGLLHTWLRREHVREWFDDVAPDEERIREHYRSRIDRTEPTHAFVVEVDGTPVGFVQWYLVDDYPDYAAVIDVERGSAGIDMFIGEPDLVGRGLGPRVIERLLDEHVFADDRVCACVIGPSVRNERAIRAYAKAGFTYVKTVQVPGEAQPEYLMVRRRLRPTCG